MDDLARIGLSELEAQLYVEVLRQPGRTAQQLSDAIDIPRTTIYGALRSLTHQGLVESGGGYGSRFRAVSPEAALTELLGRQREELVERERVAKMLIEQLSKVEAEAESEAEELVEILKDRRVIWNRFERLQAEATKEVLTLVKAPFIASRGGNPVEEEALQRGVRYRGIYEGAILNDAEIAPFLAEWVSAGEEARMYPGELPCKLALFDRRAALMPLVTERASDPTITVLLRNGALGAALGVLFDHLWSQSRGIEELRRESP